MANFNKVILAGNVTRDPELRYTPKGTAYVELGIAYNDHYTTTDGEKRETTDFFDLVFWGKQAETIAEHVKKGKGLLIEGKLKTDTWDDKETGKSRKKVTITVVTFQFLSDPSGRAPSREPAGAAERQSERREAPKSTPKPPRDPDLDPTEEDDIPF